MSYDVSSDGLLGVSSEHGCTVDLGHNLIGYDDSDTEFVGDSLKGPEEFG